MNTFRYANVMSHLIDTPLWAHPLKAAAIYNALCGRFGTLPMEPEDPQLSRFIGDWPAANEDGHDGNGRRSRTEPFRLTDKGVGIVTVTGTLVTRGAWIGSHSGMTSYEGIKHQLQRAAADSRVKSIILDLDTPGGEASGAFEAAAAVRHAAERKPVIAVANGMAASAGYALGSNATKLITTPSGVTGSIGCVLLHLDYSRAMETEGIRPTLIVAGVHKADGNPLEPLDDGATATLRSEVQRYYDLFLDTVAQGRGRRTPVSIARGTEGRAYIGRDAVDARLADDVGTFEEVLSDLTRHAARSSTPATKTQARRETMEPLLEDEKGPTLYADEMKEGMVMGKSIPDEPKPSIRLVEDSTVADGEAIQIARFKAIARDARVKGKEAFALKLACEAPDMSAEAVAALCDEIPAEGRRLSLAERNRETGADEVSSKPMPESRAASKGWDDAIAKTNERTLAEVKRHRR